MGRAAIRVSALVVCAYTGISPKEMGRAAIGVLTLVVCAYTGT